MLPAVTLEAEASRLIDQINALQELTPEIMAGAAHLFTIEPATQIRRAGGAAHAGDVHYQGENPPNGAILDYWLADAAAEGTVSIAIEEESGARVATVDGTTAQGMNRVVWDMRHQVAAGRGPLVVPGTYTARLQAAGVESAQRFPVREDPRIDAPADVRAAWTAALLELAEARARVASEGSRIEEALEGIAEDDVGPRAAKLRDLRREFGELASRFARLTGAVEGVVAPLTQDQRAQREFYMEMLETLTREAREAG